MRKGSFSPPRCNYTAKRHISLTHKARGKVPKGLVSPFGLVFPPKCDTANTASHVDYRVVLVVWQLGWVELDLRSSPSCSYLLPKYHCGGTSQIWVNPTQLSDQHNQPVVCCNASGMSALPLFTPSHFHVKIIVSAPPINRKAHQNNSEQANSIITTMASEFGGPEE